VEVGVWLQFAELMQEIRAQGSRDLGSQCSLVSDMILEFEGGARRRRLRWGILLMMRRPRASRGFGDRGYVRGLETG
jgi:hypothetical protein